jgi:hypothetical protein
MGRPEGHGYPVALGDTEPTAYSADAFPFHVWSGPTAACSSSSGRASTIAPTCSSARDTRQKLKAAAGRVDSLGKAPSETRA